jgi:hypothetical protein
MGLSADGTILHSRPKVNVGRNWESLRLRTGVALQLLEVWIQVDLAEEIVDPLPDRLVAEQGSRDRQGDEALPVVGDGCVDVGP